MKTLKDIIFSDIKVNNNDNYQIFNEGGIGKTTQMKAAYLELINTHIDKTVPIFIDCKSLNFKSDYPLLSAILEKYCGNDCMESTHLERLKKLICSETPQRDSYKYIIFIDGINECESNKNKSKVLQDIDELLKSPNNKMIVSSRINEDELVSKGFKKLKVKEFTDEQIITYLNSKGINDNGISIKLNKINPSLLKILRIPMFLKLFANTYSDPEKHIFPDIYTTNIVRKADLLQGFLDKILEDKENQHGNKIAPEYLERKFALNLFLPALAFEMSLKSTFAISEKVMTDVIDNKFSYDYFKRLTFSNDRKLFKNIDCNDVLDICKDEFSLITLSNKSYAFSHQVWRDFFCAKFYAMCIEYDIIDVFDTTISASVRQFIGEIVKNENGECECDFEKITDLEKAKKSPVNIFLQKHNLNSSSPLSPLQTHTLVEIMKTSRSNTITADYSNLDLTNSNLVDCNIPNSFFKESILIDSTLIPSGHKMDFTSAILYSNAKALITSSKDKSIILWNTDTGKEIANPIIGHTKWINQIAITHDEKNIISISNNTIKIWDINTGDCIDTIDFAHKDTITSLAISNDDKLFATGDYSGVIKIWDLNNRNALYGLFGHFKSITSIRFSNKTNNIVYSSSSDLTIRKWTLALNNHPTFSNNSSNKTINYLLRDLPNEIIMHSDEDFTKERHNAEINQIELSPNNKYLVSVGRDKKIIVWNLDAIKIHNEFLKSIELIKGEENPNIFFEELYNKFNIKNNHIIEATDDTLQTDITNIAFIDDSTIICGNQNGVVCIRELETLNIKKVLYTHKDAIKSISISNNILASTSSSEIIIYNLFNNEKIHTISQVNISHVNFSAFYKAQKLLFCASNDTLYIIDLHSGVIVNKLNFSGQLLEGIYLDEIQKTAIIYTKNYVYITDLSFPMVLKSKLKLPKPISNIEKYKNPGEYLLYLTNSNIVILNMIDNKFYYDESITVKTKNGIYMNDSIVYYKKNKILKHTINDNETTTIVSFDKPINYIYKYKNDLFISVWGKIYLLDINSQFQLIYDFYDSSKLVDIICSTKNYILLSSKNELVIINRSGKYILFHDFDGKITNIISIKNYVFSISTNEGLYIFDSKANEIIANYKCFLPYNVLNIDLTKANIDYNSTNIYLYIFQNGGKISNDHIPKKLSITYDIDET